MKCFGKKDVFAVEYELKKSPFDKHSNIELTWGIFQMWVDNKSVCTFIKDNKTLEYEWNLIYIVEWLYKNKDSIFKETQFPLCVEGNTAIELYNNSGNFDSDDEDEFNSWFEKRQDWFFKHSWYSNNGGSYLADVLFRKIDNTIEIAWDNLNLYNEVQFINPKGVYYIPFDLFRDVINSFIEDFILEISKTEEGKILLENLVGM